MRAYWCDKLHDVPAMERSMLRRGLRGTLSMALIAQQSIKGTWYYLWVPTLRTEKALYRVEQNRAGATHFHDLAWVVWTPENGFEDGHAARAALARVESRP